jgi:glycerol uptake operon antiterminator
VDPLDFQKVLKDKPVIAAIREMRQFGATGVSEFNLGIFFIIGGNIFDLPIIAKQAARSRKMVFVDIDLIKGIGKDAFGIRYLARNEHIHGIITTKSNLINSARKEGLSSIQRIFVLDSESLTGGLNVITKSRPDAVEVLPGLILPKIMNRIRATTAVPIIAGGLITTPDEVNEILSSGAIGISTSTAKLWGPVR